MISNCFLLSGAFLAGVPIQPVLLRYPNKLVSEAKSWQKSSWYAQCDHRSHSFRGVADIRTFVCNSSRSHHFPLSFLYCLVTSQTQLNSHSWLFTRQKPFKWISNVQTFQGWNFKSFLSLIKKMGLNWAFFLDKQCLLCCYACFVPTLVLSLPTDQCVNNIPGYFIAL